MSTNHHGDEGDCDEGNECRDNALHEVHVRHQQREDEHVGERDERSGPQRQSGQELDRDGRANDLRYVGRGDRNLRREPQEDDHGARVGVAASLREVTAGRDAEPDAQRLCKGGSVRGPLCTHQPPHASCTR